MQLRSARATQLRVQRVEDGRRMEQRQSGVTGAESTTLSLGVGRVVIGPG